MSKTNEKYNEVFLCVMGMLIAVEIVLERLLAVNLLTFKINIAFVAVAVAAYLYGPIGGAICYGLGDVIGTLVIPTSGGSYNPLFTLTCVLVGILYGVCLKGNPSWWRIALASLLARTVGTLGLNTLWISLFFTKAKVWSWGIFYSRLPEAGIMFAAELIILLPLFLGGKSWMNHIRSLTK